MDSGSINLGSNPSPAAIDIFERIKKFNLSVGHYAVFGSALFDVWGIRRAADLDIIVTPELYNKLKEERWKEQQAHGFTMLVKDDANVTTVQEKATDGEYFPDRIQLIKDAIHINGVPFVRAEEVIACKKDYNRPKDLTDIAAIERYVQSRNGKNVYDI